jgi:DNA-binding NarL/FixJ family response regulator
MRKLKSNKTAFTFSEQKIIALVCQQNTSGEIAGKLQLSKRTVEDYRANIMKKMSVKNSVGILIFALKNGLFKL